LSAYVDNRLIAYSLPELQEWDLTDVDGYPADSSAKYLWINDQIVMDGNGEAFDQSEFISLLDLEHGRMIRLDNKECECDLSWLSLNPDRTQYAMECGNSRIKLVLNITDECVELAYPETGRARTAVAWSPDGKWLAYILFAHFNDPGEHQGLYIMDTNCLENLDSCPDLTTGPYWVLIDPAETIEWSPDSRHLAFVGLGGSRMHIFDIEKRTFVEVEFESWVVLPTWIDNETIAINIDTPNSKTYYSFSYISYNIQSKQITEIVHDIFDPIRFSFIVE
jgi:WD40 repeat protein